MITLGFDDNLGLPSDFVTHVECELVAYHDVGKLLTDFSHRKLSAIFTPAGSLPYVAGDYSFLAQATLDGLTTHVNTTFFTHSTIQIEEIPYQRIGRVNPYCTTSYWNPLIQLAKVLPAKTKLNFYNTEGFDDLFNKTVQGDLDCAMLWDRVYRKYPEEIKKLYPLLEENNSPTPVIIGNLDVPQRFIKELQSFQSIYAEGFFSGFTKPNIEQLKQFIDRMLFAQDFFGL